MSNNKTEMIDLLGGSTVNYPIINNYNLKGFLINNINYNFPVLINQEGVKAWNLKTETITVDDLLPFTMQDNKTEILLLGVGASPKNPEYEIKSFMSKSFIKVDIMSTESACRTWNILVSEHRIVSAGLLLPV